ncbi:MAG: quinone-dependent dihydroorotate dehydrogenase [Chthonomonas sp.]|nr:quinone-dependent dihydroorotate dehydrogenase [Chthonomonas sp.]
MSYEKLLRPWLFRLDPEVAHNAALWAIAKGIVKGKILADPRLRVSACGLEFPNPLGLAAGVDKNGIAIDRWAQMGFGSAEIGTVTAIPQSGNVRPRLFRFPEQRAVINRMGFNNHGARDLSLALAQRKCTQIPVGVNIGKSKVTPLAEAPQDYLFSYRHLAKFADYVVVNVSSPNTPGLRDLQGASALREILLPLLAEPVQRPLFVKIAPDLHFDDIAEIAMLAKQIGLAGIVATNTTLDHSSIPSVMNQSGGLSGAPLFEKSNAVIRHIKSLAPELTIVGVGGVFSGADLKAKLDAGASWVQVYTGWVYGGPMMPFRTLIEYLALLDESDR